MSRRCGDTLDANYHEKLVKSRDILADPLNLAPVHYVLL